MLLCAARCSATALSEPPLAAPAVKPAGVSQRALIVPVSASGPGAAADPSETPAVQPARARILLPKPVPAVAPAEIAPPIIARGQLGLLGPLTAAQPASQLSPQLQSWQGIPDGPHLPNYAFDDVNSPISFADGPFSTRDNCFWFSGEYLMAWMHGATLPQLVTTSIPGTAQSAAGVIGAPGTSTLFGGTAASDGGLCSGLRLGAGWWFSDDRTLGLEAGFMALQSQTSGFAATSNGSQILARPYTDATTSLNQAVLLAFPGSVRRTSVVVAANSAGFFSGNIDFVDKNYETSWYRLSSIFGYRYYTYSENLRIDQDIMPTSTAFVPGTQIASSDHFATRNIFNGADLGLRNEFYWNNFSLEVLTKIAIGRMNALASVNGSSVTSVPGTAPVISQNGVYALGSNSGAFSRDHMAILPELGLTLKWQVCNCTQLRLGYSLMLLNGAVCGPATRSTKLINPANFVPGTVSPSPNEPSFMLRTSDVWIQSLNFGLVITF